MCSTLKSRAGEFWNYLFHFLSYFLILNRKNERFSKCKFSSTFNLCSFFKQHNFTLVLFPKETRLEGGGPADPTYVVLEPVTAVITMPSMETMKHVLECAKNAARTLQLSVIAEYSEAGKIADCPKVPFQVEIIKNNN